MVNEYEREQIEVIDYLRRKFIQIRNYFYNNYFSIMFKDNGIDLFMSLEFRGFN